MKRFILFLSISFSCVLVSLAIERPCDREFITGVRLDFSRTVDHPFTIDADGTKVVFSKGNLQYRASTNEWRFALNQYDYVGNLLEGNVYDENGAKSSNTLIGENYTGWIDLFGWATSGYRVVEDAHNINYMPYAFDTFLVNRNVNRYGYGPSIYDAALGSKSWNMDFTRDQLTSMQWDWGCNVINEYKTIYEKDGSKKTYKTTYNRTATITTLLWHTLTKDEWDYLLFKRKMNGQPNPWAFATINPAPSTRKTYQGLLIFPDDFLIRQSAGTYIPNGGTVSLDSVQWRMAEDAGAVFLPMAGRRSFKNVVSMEYGNYWSSTHKDERYSYGIITNAAGGGDVRVTSFDRANGCSVRLVRKYKQ